MGHSTLPSLPLRAVENVLRQLLNDMRTVTEARCSRHGAGGGTTANSAAGLLPCIGVEIIATRTQTGTNRDDSVRRVFSEIATLVGYQPYATLGFPLFKMLRNGLAHERRSSHLPIGHKGESIQRRCVDSQPRGQAPSRSIVDK